MKNVKKRLKEINHQVQKNPQIKRKKIKRKMFGIL